MAEAIFLSASVPDPKRGANYAATADSVAITAAVSALVHVTLGRRLLVWGGHPAITPMIWVVAEEFGVDYGSWVRLYQSRHFAEDFPEENERFRNVTYTNEVNKGRHESLLTMRQKMFSDHLFDAAVFIGGMGGVIDEFRLFRQLHPKAAVVPVVSTGGAVIAIAQELATLEADLSNDFDYVGLFHRHLRISVREERYPQPEDQPVAVDQRYWHPARR